MFSDDPEIVVACVRTGTKYPFDHVLRLRNMVAANLPVPHQFVCLTDQLFAHSDIGCVMIPPRVKHKEWFNGWWGKMVLFEPHWRRGRRVIYLDLDTVVCGDLTPLAEVKDKLAVCANFTRAAGHHNWPCRYGSCAMVINPAHEIDEIFRTFNTVGGEVIKDCKQYGDQLALEMLYPYAAYLQDRTPKGFFLGRRELTQIQPKDASVVVFAGSAKPHTTDIRWARAIWENAA